MFRGEQVHVMVAAPDLLWYDLCQAIQQCALASPSVVLTASQDLLCKSVGNKKLDHPSKAMTWHRA